MAPVTRLVPPVAAANQLMVGVIQVDDVTDKTTVPVPHLDADTGINAWGTTTVTAPETLLVTKGEQVPLTTQ